MTLAPALPADVERSNEDLLSLSVEGNDRAFTALYDRTSSRVLGLVRRILIDPAQSEEVTQEVFLQAWKEAAHFDPLKGTATAWLLVRARRRAIDRVRSSQAARDRDVAVGIRDLEATRDDVAETAEILIEHQRVATSMKALTPAHREALELTYFGGYTQSEAAVKAGVPIGTMKTRIRDALIALRKLVVEPRPAWS
ncbi:sigma-70 family RNA polymerase sigma factor [Frigoribacterium sp. CFBP9039]|uniref:sigma-70 family RNA polymerase sigma factor n=1 Tax=unclassified Frigoribacterium TaxID=2627005 RepID=UPI002A69F60B|nr:MULTISPECIES: sigma-70 family RNA polymerase sigma factor [unclassified Frigoribacterium]MDY0891501.1 sigma-70 family RNA polymerase sigma factor [Frigoribacterium sp. CFBP9030]MDY0945920.1 sigma-70 family RNA polymerase sigma factor [Frigoribacterium sp. CFBP9039]